MVRSGEDKVEIIFLYGECGRSYKATARRFNELYPDRPIDHRYVSRLVQKLRDTFSLTDRMRTGRPPSDEATVLEVIGRVSMNYQQSLTEIRKSSNIPKSSIQRILKKHSFHPYKMHITQELAEDDFDRRLEFCELMTERIAEREHLLENICFSDESTFYLQGCVNTHNVRFWSDSNPHVLTEGHTQKPEKINVWAGILGNHIIGPLFIEGNLTGQTYLDMLRDTVDPLITELVENAANENGEPEFDVENIFFQQDGCPAHFHRVVRDYLDDAYPNRWIGRRGTIEWPPRSPDLAPNDFFLWGHLKSVVFRTPPHSVDELKTRITRACHEISTETFRKVREEFHYRLFHCQEVNGVHFEHLLK